MRRLSFGGCVRGVHEHSESIRGKRGCMAALLPRSALATKLPAAGVRTCTECCESKADICFHIFRHSKDALTPYYCRMCRCCSNKINRHVATLKKEHPVPPLGTPCEICERISNKLHLDHDRKTELQEFRGFLCIRCNTSLGGLGDNLEGLTRAIEYLNKCKPLCKQPTTQVRPALGS